MSNARENVNLLTSADFDIAALRLANWGAGAVPPQVMLKQNWVAGDGGGLFRYDASDTTTADDGGTVIVDAAGNRWKRQYDQNGALTWFGARIDNTTNDAAALTAANATGLIYFLKNGTLFANASLVGLNQLKIEGNGKLRFQDGTTLPGFVHYRNTLPGGFDTNNISVWDGDYSWTKPEYWRDDSNRVNGLATPYYSKPHIPHMELYDSVTTGHSGTISFLAAPITAGSTTSVALVSADGLQTGDTVAFMTNFLEVSQADRRVITRSGNTISWTGPLANSYTTATGTVTNAQRTSFIPRQMYFNHRQQGDGLLLSLRGNIDVTTLYAGQTKTDQRATIGLLSGDLTANTHGVNLTVEEFHAYSTNKAVGMLLYTGSVERNVAYSGWSEYVGASYIQSGGSQYADFGHVIAGKFDVGFSTHLLDASNNSQCAFALAQGQRIYFDATAGATLGKVIPGDTYIEQRSADNSMRRVVQNIVGDEISQTGDVSHPNKAAVVVRLNASTSNDKTGDGTVYKIPFNTEELDQNNRFNTTNHNFTATVNGLYFISGQVILVNVGGSHSAGRIYITTSSGLDYIFYYEPSDMVTGDGVAALQFNALVKMAAAETVHIDLYVAGSTKTIGIVGGAALETFLTIAQVA
jgi:hypothetical protein